MFIMSDLKFKVFYFLIFNYTLSLFFVLKLSVSITTNTINNLHIVNIKYICLPV